MGVCASMGFGCNNTHIEDLYRDLPSLEPIMCDESMGLCDATDLNAYFSNYWDNTNTEPTQEEKPRGGDGGVNTYKEIVINVEEELAKYPELNCDDEDNDDDDDEFEKL